MEICTKSMPAFDNMCGLLHAVLQTVQIHTPNAYVRIVFLSVRYWTKDHVIYYVRNYLEKLRNHCKSLLSQWDHQEGDMQRVKLDGTWTVKYLFAMILIKLEQHGPRAPILPSVSKEWLHDCMKMRRIVRGKFSLMLRCSSEQCNKFQKYIEDPFKLCGGCKMTYYCSRSCQKRAWPQHKSYCMTLRRLYQ